MRVLYSRIIPIFLGILVLYWFVPQSYLRATRSEFQQTRAYYSPVIQEFIVWNQGAQNFTMQTEQGRPLTRKEGAMLLPFLFARDVEKWGGFPLSINGREYTFNDAKTMRTFKISPRMALSGLSRLYLILESQPETSSFSLPDDVMILKTDSVSFVNVENGNVNTEKSQLFTKSILDAGAVFPWKAAANNPDPLKELDEGLFFVDANNTLFQLLMAKGQPVVKNTGYTIPGTILALTVREHNAKEFYGLIATKEALYVNRYNNAPLPMPFEFYPAQQSLDMTATALTRNFNISTVDGTSLQGRISIATDKQYSILRQYKTTISPEQQTRYTWVQRGLWFLTPFSFTQFTPTQPGIVFLWRASPFPLFSLAGACAGMLLYLAIQFYKHRQRRKLIQHNIFELLIILVCGIPAAVMLAVFGPVTGKWRDFVR